MNYSINKSILFPLLLICSLVSTSLGKDYVVLVSGGMARYDDNMYDSEYWYDLVSAYNMLITMGHTHEDVIVCYGEGTDFNSANPHFQNKFAPTLESITDYNNHKSTINAVLADLGTKMTSNDRIIFWWVIGHGSAGEPGKETMDAYAADIFNFYHPMYPIYSDILKDDEFKVMLDQIHDFKQKVVLWGTCKSGAIRDDLAGNKTVVVTACEYDETHESGVYTLSGLEGATYADFPRYVTDAILQSDIVGNDVAADENGSGVVSIEEAGQYAYSQYKDKEDEPVPYNTVCYSDNGNTIGETFIKSLGFWTILDEQFENGWNGWQFYAGGSAVAEAYVWAIDYPNNALTCYISNTGQNTWDIHARKDGIRLQEGKYYTIRFDARSESGLSRDINVVLQKGSYPYTNYSNLEPVTINGTMKTYEYTFRMEQPTDTWAGVCFEMGKFPNETDPIDVIIDNVVLEEEIPHN